MGDALKFRAVLLFGAPGCGKGTQGRILGALPNFFHCSCGEVFRGLRLDSELGKVFAAYSSRGALVPDEPTVELWRQYIAASQQAGRFDPGSDTLVLDGIPRNRQQAEMLSDALEVRAVLHLQCPSAEKLVERLQRRALRDNRLDDANREVIAHRLATYEREAAPVLEYYGPGLLRPIDATKPPIAVLQDILAALPAL